MDNEIRNFLNTFFYFYNKLGDDSKIFFERLLQEADSVRNGNAQNDFMGIFEEELKKFVGEQELQDLTQAQNRDVGNKGLEDNSNSLFATEINQTQTEIEVQDKNKQTQEQNTQSLNTQENIESLKTFTLPLNWENFELNMDMIANKLLENNLEDLKNMNLYKEQDFLGTPLGIYAKSNLFSEEKIKEFKVQYAKSYLEKLSKELNMPMNFLYLNANDDVIFQSNSNMSQSDFLELIKNTTKDYSIDSKEISWNFDINDVRKNHLESKDFIQAFQDELKNSSQKEKIDHMIDHLNNVKSTIENHQNLQDRSIENINHSLNNNNDLDRPQLNIDNLESINNKENPAYSNLLDFFEKKRIENQNMPISKDEFKKDFFLYCKNNMGENEMQILINLYNKEPSKLTREHKTMLEQGMRYNLINNNLLSKDLENSIRSTIGELLEKNKEASRDPIKEKSNQEIKNEKTNEIKENKETSKTQTINTIATDGENKAKEQTKEQSKAELIESKGVETNKETPNAQVATQTIIQSNQNKNNQTIKTQKIRPKAKIQFQMKDLYKGKGR